MCSCWNDEKKLVTGKRGASLQPRDIAHIENHRRQLYLLLAIDGTRYCPWASANVIRAVGNL